MNEQTPVTYGDTTPCRRDCEYYSRFTESCDYTLIFYRSRPCPAAACTVFKQRVERRPWFAPSANASRPRDERFIVAGCGHEVYAGDSGYKKDGATKCAECVTDEFNALSADDRAELLGYSRCGEVE